MRRVMRRIGNRGFLEAPWRGVLAFMGLGSVKVTFFGFRVVEDTTE
jgi:hypothetical protein